MSEGMPEPTMPSPYPPQVQSVNPRRPTILCGRRLPPHPDFRAKTREPLPQGGMKNRIQRAASLRIQADSADIRIRLQKLYQILQPITPCDELHILRPDQDEFARRHVHQLVHGRGMRLAPELLALNPLAPADVFPQSWFHRIIVHHNPFQVGIGNTLPCGFQSGLQIMPALAAHESERDHGPLGQN